MTPESDRREYSSHIVFMDSKIPVQTQQIIDDMKEIGRQIIVSSQAKIDRVNLLILEDNKFQEIYKPKCFGLYTCETPYTGRQYGPMDCIYLIIGCYAMMNGYNELLPSYVANKYVFPSCNIDVLAGTVAHFVAREQTKAHMTTIIIEQHWRPEDIDANKVFSQSRKGFLDNTDENMESNYFHQYCQYKLAMLTCFNWIERITFKKGE